MISLFKHSKNLFLMLMATMAISLVGTNVAGAADKVGVSLDGNHEVPSNVSTASGSGNFTITDDKSISGSVTAKGMEGSAAHIHDAAVGKNGPVVVALVKGEAGVWSVPANTKLTDAQFASFKAGNLYVNVHSATYPTGEIRGQLPPK